ncbi:RelE family toxin-antitoxin system [Klebsiella pneumoniae]|nr:ead/Ea22-like family protein [Klebsiella pneumoniae]VGB86446.1 RelE family toxin-antitoxin system [Klebsiella pneumoniae]
MTDITELAQALKAAAEKATPGPWYVHDKPCEDGNYGIDTSDKEFLAEAVVWWGFARQSIWREEDAKYIALANPANILALVEALEKAQQQMAESENRVRKQNRHICELFDDNTALRQRIAELESRAVKLIDCDFGAVQHMSGGSTDYCNGFVDGTQNAIRSISAAGIKVEAK